MRNKLAGWFLLGALCVLGIGQVAAATLPIPNPEDHADFLLEPWKPNAPILLVFKDPFCPYCLQAFKRKDELKAYNAFLFWYPIFGDRSEKRVAELFQCSSPVSQEVIAAVLKHESPGCKNAPNRKLMELNRQMYEAYSPAGVPAYYFGGAKVSLAELNSLKKATNAISPTVAMDWNSYKKNLLVQQSAQLTKIALLTPNGYKKLDELMAIVNSKQQYDWYFFLGGKEDYQKYCKSLAGGCGAKAIDSYFIASEELKLLFGLENIDEVKVVINGRLLSSREIEKYIDLPH